MITAYICEKMMIEKAIEIMSRQSTPNFAATAQDLGVSCDGSSARFAGVKSKMYHPAPNTKPSVKTEQEPKVISNEAGLNLIFSINFYDRCCKRNPCKISKQCVEKACAGWQQV